MASTSEREIAHSNRVLAFAVDDNLFCVDLERVEAVCQKNEVTLHVVKQTNAAGRHFLVHRGEPALSIDLREAFGLSDVLGTIDRPAFLVLRAGSFLLALQIDAFVGVRDLDLRTGAPLPTALMHDGGLCVGHLVEQNGTLYTLLQPNRILRGELRDKLGPVTKKAQDFCDREEKLAAVIVELRHTGTPEQVKTYGRLSRRNGHTRAAAAARLVLKAAQETEQRLDGNASSIAGTLSDGTLLRDLIALSTARQTGQMHLELTSGDSAVVHLAAGRIADAVVGKDRGQLALKHILAANDGTYRFVSSDVPVHPQRIEDATMWSLIEALGHLASERRGRSQR